MLKPPLNKSNQYWHNFVCCFYLFTESLNIEQYITNFHFYCISCSFANPDKKYWNYYTFSVREHRLFGNKCRHFRKYNFMNLLQSQIREFLSVKIIESGERVESPRPLLCSHFYIVKPTAIHLHSIADEWWRSHHA